MIHNYLLIFSLAFGFTSRSLSQVQPCNSVNTIDQLVSDTSKALPNIKERIDCINNHSDVITLTVTQIQKVGLPTKLDGKTKIEQIREILELMHNRKFYKNMSPANRPNGSRNLAKLFSYPARQILEEGLLAGCTQSTYVFVALAKFYGLSDFRILHGVSPTDYTECVCENGKRVYRNFCGGGAPKNIVQKTTKNKFNGDNAIPSHWFVAVKGLKDEKWNYLDVAAAGDKFEDRYLTTSKTPDNFVGDIVHFHTGTSDFFRGGLWIDYVGLNDNDPLCIFNGKQSLNAAATGLLNQDDQNKKCRMPLSVN